MTTRERGLLHPIALTAIATLIVNDHVLKVASPSWLTGKLSDVAGLMFFPLLVFALVRPFVRELDRRGVVIACAVVTGIAFTAIKVWAPATAACEWSLGALQWPLRLDGPIAPVAITRDPTDLVALPSLLVAIWIGASRSSAAPVTAQA